MCVVIVITLDMKPAPLYTDEFLVLRTLSHTPDKVWFGHHINIGYCGQTCNLKKGEVTMAYGPVMGC